MNPIVSRGPLSATLLDIVGGPSDGPGASSALARLPGLTEGAVSAATDLLTDDDLQLSHFLLYSLFYGEVVDPSGEWEWHPQVLAARAVLDAALEDALRAAVPRPERPEPTREAIAEALFALTADTGGPSLARYVAQRATRDQLDEFLMQRSIYTLKEADPHSWAIPRLTGAPKAALVEIQADEYGGGRPARMHSTIFAATMRGCGLDDTYGAYLDAVPAITLASVNTMSLFGLHRRLRGAIVGHLAAFEMTSSIPNRLYGRGFRRHGFGDDVCFYFDEHVAADAVHEQIAGRDLAGQLGEEHPELLDDILLGAAACLAVDGWAAEHMLTRWEAGESSLRVPVANRSQARP